MYLPLHLVWYNTATGTSGQQLWEVLLYSGHLYEGLVILSIYVTKPSDVFMWLKLQMNSIIAVITQTALIDWQNIIYRSPPPSQQECIPVGCVPPAAVAVRGVSTRLPLRTRPLRPGNPRNQTPLDQPPPPPGADPPVDRMTDRCKHITLPQFVGGKNVGEKGQSQPLRWLSTSHQWWPS